jgi:hypothetical protein
MEHQIALRIVADVFKSVRADQLDRRADEFARVGNARCDEVAKALRSKAWLLRHPNFGTIDG